jgi:membrane protein DedA with SNARE-associated domain
MLLFAALYAGATHLLFIPLVIVATASGTILGDNLGFWAGCEGGYRLPRRFGHYNRMEDRRLKPGQYLSTKNKLFLRFHPIFPRRIETKSISRVEILLTVAYSK